MRTPMNEIFRFRMLTELHCGVGITDNIAPQLIGIPTERCCVIVDRNVKMLPAVQNLIGQFKEFSALQCQDGPIGEPDFDYLENLKKSTSAHNPSAIIGIGGGSTMDSAKGLSIVLTNDGPCEKYQGLALYKHQGLPCVTIPTLFGSGAEITPSAVFINRTNNKKGGINGPAVFPNCAIIDPKMMLGAPISTIGSTAMDAMVHAIESYTARCATPVSKMFSENALKTIVTALDILKTDSDSLEGLSILARGTFLAITALMHSEQGLAGGSSYPMGVFYNIPHGVGGGRCLPHAILFNARKKEKLWDELATKALHWSQGNGLSSAQILADKLLGYLDDFQVPLLHNWLSTEHIKQLAQETFNFRGVLEQNPVDLSLEDIEDFFEKMLNNESSISQYN